MSQQTAPTEPKEILEIRFLIYDHEKALLDYNHLRTWLVTVFTTLIIPPIAKAELHPPVPLKPLWDEDNGELIINDSNIISWLREDGGPKIEGKISPTQYLILCLQNRLMTLLLKSKFGTYIKTGYPHDWKQSEIWINGERKSDLIWACAIQGRYATHERNAKGQVMADESGKEASILIKQAHVIIARNQSENFF